MTFIPVATYRIQFHKEFGFRHLLPHIPYLAELGISTIYASPIQISRPGSTHGYDVTDSRQLDPEIGTMAEFEELQAEIRKYGLSWLQDIVPNHMAFHPQNLWLMDVFEKGPASEYYRFFDINWQHADPALQGKLMTPFLGAELPEVIKAGEVSIGFSEAGFGVKFYENEFPVSVNSWPLILEFIAENATGKGEKSGEFSQLIQPFRDWQNAPAKKAHHAEWEALKTSFLEKVKAAPDLKKRVDNGIKKLHKSPKTLLEILDQQYFRLVPWPVTDRQINYRRFFTINELLCLRMENPKVFDAYHSFIRKLYRKGYIQGLRVDHVDGLFDPVAYLHKLRETVGPECYLTIEKILDLGEELPESWPVQGTTGYFFLAMVNQLFTNSAAEKQFTRIYQDQAPEMSASDYEQLVFEKKMYMLENHMQGELDNLFALCQELELLPTGPGYSEERLKDALRILLASFPVYRLYANALPVTGQDADILEYAFAQAEKFARYLQKELRLFHEIFQGETGNLPGTPENRLHFLMRMQQFTGPLAAKGVEDTTFYHYNRLISHNEVGDNPEVFGITIERFHKEMQERQQAWPLAQNATATHDTKRGEDARLRLNVLSELGEEWENLLQQWQEQNRPFLTEVNGEPSPSHNRIYFLYQAILGAFPISGEPETDFPDRVREALTKAVREAKVHSNWSDPNEQYEQHLHDFAARILEPDSAFCKLFVPFVSKVSFYGMLYTLGQTLLKITAPGIPDIYQGCELWDFSMVDPDNRRPVDFELRKQYLEELKKSQENGILPALKTLMENWQDGKLKLYTTWRALHFRQANQPLFIDGEYLPLSFEAGEEGQVAGFARKNGDHWCLVITPLAVVTLVRPVTFPLGKSVWQEAAVILPETAPTNWLNCFTGERISGKGSLFLSEILAHFPIALLTSENQ